MKHTQTIAMARSLLAEGRGSDVARMLEPLIESVPDDGSAALGADQVVLRCLLARVRLLRYGDVQQARALLQPFEKATERATLPPLVQAEVALWLGWIRIWHTRPTYNEALALRLLDEALHGFEQAMNTSGRCWALLGRAHAYFTIDEYSLMQQALSEASRLQEKLNDAYAALWLLDFQTLAARFACRYDNALAYAEKLLAQANTLNDTFGKGRALACRAALYNDLGRSPDPIIEAAEQAVHFLSRTADKPGHWLFYAYRAHIETLLRQGHTDGANRLITTALDAASDQPAAAPYLLLLRIRLQIDQNNFEEAESLFTTVDAQMHRLQNRLLTADAALVRSVLLEKQDDLDKAVHWAEKSYQVARETGQPRQQVRALLHLAHLHLLGDDEAEARHHLAASETFSHLFGVLPIAALRYEVLGQLALSESEEAAAHAAFAQARTARALIGDVRQTSDLPTPKTEVAHHPIAALSQAAFSVDLIAEAWLNAAQRLLPSRWMGVYRCDEGQPWRCVREHGEAPTAPPRMAEPCSAQLVANDVCWLRLRAHPGPAFFFGIQIQTPEDAAWEATHETLQTWLPVASLALDHALLQSRSPSADSTEVASHEAFLYTSEAMRALVHRIRQISHSHSAVLITGEQGVGKERIARAIHATSERAAAPFVMFDGAGRAEKPLASHLFGQDTAPPINGAFREAGNGTLLIDDIGHLPLDLQRRLLHALQNGEVVPVGANQAVEVNARVLATTSQSLQKLVEKGHFLEKLYHRLRVISLAVPSLRERREDIPLLVQHFLTTLRPNDALPPSVTPAALHALTQYDWPGNVRQLRNEVERCLA
ncbi:MAG TPA: sigma 54-interacting transcriptional regulator, partial [Rhodothermales bacterium]|nr:sigma 54-interacting transcriptional regulator [Rhodothermales bacterium]